MTALPSFEPEDERWCPSCERFVRYHFGYTDVLLACWCPRCGADLTTPDDVWTDAGDVLEDIVRDVPTPDDALSRDAWHEAGGAGDEPPF